MQKRYYFIPIILSTLFLACGGGGEGETNATPAITQTDTKYNLAYKGLVFYHENLPMDHYQLEPLSNDEFNNLTPENKLRLSNKLLNTLFFGYPQKILEKKINTGSFITDIRDNLEQIQRDTASVENQILNEHLFSRSKWNEQEAIDILSRFYVMGDLDRYFLHNWIAYTLTQTIMFSPAYELESTHTPNIAQVYNRIVNLLNEEAGMRYISYIHMSSEDNWRRFRSPEDNGREMLEIFTLDMDDGHVPIAGKALQNWKLDKNSDTLVVGLNHNTKALKLFGATIYNGDDFYRELVKSDLFTKGVTQRLIDFFFPNYSNTKKEEIAQKIIASQAETWQDILLQIIFSKEYLLHNTRAKSAEETFFSLAKKMDFQHRKTTLHQFKNALEEMHQASMKYKLGKLERVPLDTLSFVNYHQYIREELLLQISNPEKAEDYESWGRQGWSFRFVQNDGIDYTGLTNQQCLDLFINYIFQSIIYRNPTSTELQMFEGHMLEGEKFTCCFDMFEEKENLTQQESKRLENKSRIARVVLEYISRLEDTYIYKEVK